MNNLTIAIMVAEILFLCFVIAFYLLIMSRKNNEAYKNIIKSLRHDVAEHVRQIQQLQRQLVAEKLARNNQSKSQSRSDSVELDHCHARIANLEKFKDLFFALEDKLRSSADAVQQDAKGDDAFQDIIHSQAQEIKTLREELNKSSAQLMDSGQLAEGVNSSIVIIENSVEELSKKLEHARRQRALAEKEIEELRVFKAQAKELQVIEARLKEKFAEQTQELNELRVNSAKKNPHGVVRIKEIENLSKKLEEKEADIRRLREECETIGVQYEELATRSLKLLGEKDGLTESQKEELADLKKRLEESSEALNLKQAECQLLENYYLELEGELHSEAAGELFTTALDSLVSLETERVSLVDQIKPILDASVADELLLLKDQLAEKERQLAAKETELDEVRLEYSDIRQQFIEVAQEDASLRAENQMLQSECELLRTETNRLNKQLNGLQGQESELAALKDEYHKMESRYLAVIEKYKDKL